jgi:tRNA(Ile)-lysidine synthase
VNRSPSTPDAAASLAARAVGLDGVTAPVVVACSGGADSLALVAVAAARGLAPLAVHVDHGLRAGSAAEAGCVAAAVAVIGAAFQPVTVEVAPGPNLEARARRLRYDALERVRVEVGASATLVGHTADDQAETVLLNVLRGSGSAGLGAMAPRRGTLVRPLLAVRRADTEACCAALGLSPLRDPMNEDPSFRRVWIRREVLPLLSRGAERDLVPVLARQAEHLRAESDFLDELAAAAWPLGDATPVQPLLALAPVLARRALRCWIGPPPPSADEVERVLAVARGEVVATELAGGLRIERSHGELRQRRPG